ncbi:MAG: NADH-quinone oxidoreductase subunit L [Desulfarculus sp.]|nr:MAG: NADH-quinone oxidoreductase subunit L [Desulfarculus sp.]
MNPVAPSDFVLWLTLAAMWLPFISFLTIFFITRTQLALSLAVSVSCAAVSLLAAWYLLLGLPAAQPPVEFKMLWMAGAEARISYGFLLDPLSRLMLCIVASISFLVQVYSLGYMAGDDGMAKYYSFLSLFAWSMISLVVAPGLLQLYVFWELVGLSSYLLIGFWHHKFSASEAGKKAFVMTRLGDLGFFLGIIVLLLHLGDLSILKLNAQAAAKLSAGLVTASAVLIFMGVVGKSAQFPLLTWLPDAMEGPTPVSALLHSATMVAAGVYLVSRLFPFYAASPDALMVVLAIGTVTMLLSSTMAMVARDIKQVWAFSTVSQLGFMLMGLGAGSYFAGVFHLTTHAAFKALLFLCSGVFIHHFGSNDMYDIARGGGRRLKVPMITITIAGAALAGVFPAAGFFSKESIMGALAGLPQPGWLAAGLAGAAMTAYYTSRLLFVLWFPRQIAAPHHEEHGHGEAAAHSAFGYWAMGVPLLILAGFALVLGFFGDGILNFLHWGRPPEFFHHVWLAPVSLILVACGIGLAWLEFGRKKAAQAGFLSRLPAVEALFANRWYMDAFYRCMLDYVVYGVFSRLFTLNDRRVVDGGVDGVCRGTVGGGWLLSFLQSGLLQYNLFTMVLIIALVGLYFLVMH